MPLSKLFALVIRNANRNRRQFLLSAFGIVIGIAAFVFFLALSMGVREVVLGKIFPVERVDVISPRATLGTGRKITDAVVEKIRNRPEVESAVPRMAMSFPARGRGYFQGRKIDFEAGGFADGVPAEFLEDESFGEHFKDWYALENGQQRPACVPKEVACPDADFQYCDRRDMTCRHRVPLVISRRLLEIYNTQFADSHGLPQIGVDIAKFIVERGGYKKMRIYLALGDTVVTGSNRNLKGASRTVEAVFLGISDKAIPLGVTVPIGYIKRWNKEFGGEEAARAYSSVAVTVRKAEGVATFGAWLEEELELTLADSYSERFSLVIMIVTGLFIMISLIIVTISAINISQNFFMLVSERRREIGLMRALGATRRDIASVFVGEAALIGVVSGVIGTIVAVLAGRTIDYLSASRLPNFMFKPETYFSFEWWILLGGVGFAVVFSVVGGMWPARRAARLHPAQALAQQ